MSWRARSSVLLSKPPYPPVVKFPASASRQSFRTFSRSASIMPTGSWCPASTSSRAKMIPARAGKPTPAGKNARRSTSVSKAFRVSAVPTLASRVGAVVVRHHARIEDVAAIGVRHHQPLERDDPFVACRLVAREHKPLLSAGLELLRRARGGEQRAAAGDGREEHCDRHPSSSHHVPAHEPLAR